QGAGIWRDGLRLDRVQPTKAIAETINKESKHGPTPGAKRPPKTAQARCANCTYGPEGENGELERKSIEEGRSGEISGLTLECVQIFDINRADVAEQQYENRQADRRLGSGDRQDEEDEHLPRHVTKIARERDEVQ